MNNNILFSFVVAVSDRYLLKNNFLESPCFFENHRIEIILKEGFESATKAYNSGIKSASGEYIVFIHQDVFLPENWLNEVLESICTLEQHDVNWGVLGCYGVTPSGEGKGFVFSTGLGNIGMPFKKPENVRILDEIVLIIKNNGKLKFDENLPYFHLYGADLCLTANNLNLKNYVLPAFCFHNTKQIVSLPTQFYECYKFIKKKWKKELPICTPCIKITRWKVFYFYRRIKEIINCKIRGLNGEERISGSFKEHFHI